MLAVSSDPEARLQGLPQELSEFEALSRSPDSAGWDTILLKLITTSGW